MRLHSWRLRAASFLAGGTLGEKRLNPAYCISPHMNVLGVVVYICRVSWVGGSSDPVWWASVPFSQPPFPACCSEGLSGFYSQEIWRADALNSPCSQVLSFPPSQLSLTHGIFLHPMCCATYVSSQPLGIRMLLPFYHCVLSSRGLRDKDNFQTEPGTKQKTGPAEDCLNGLHSRQQEASCIKQKGHKNDSEGSWWGRQVFLMVTFCSLQ